MSGALSASGGDAEEVASEADEGDEDKKSALQRVKTFIARRRSLSAAVTTAPTAAAAAATSASGSGSGVAVLAEVRAPCLARLRRSLSVSRRRSSRCLSAST